MRLDKFTTKFQEALSDAQSIALGNDHAYIEPVHMLVAMLKQDDGPKALLQRAGANVPGLLAAAEAADWAPVPDQHGPGAGRPRAGPCAAGHGEGGHQARRPVHCQRAVLAGRDRQQGRGGKNSQGQRPHAQEPGGCRLKPCAAARRWTAPRPKASAVPWPNTAWT